MAEKNKNEPTTIKKYANRRLYHTGTSSYVTLEDLALMVRQGEDFVVVDAKSGEDITRSVLTQIIFEQEAKGHNMLPSAFLRQLIQFYGDNMQSLIPNYLEFSLDRFIAEQTKLREQFSKGFAPGTFATNPFSAAPNPFGTNVISAMQEQANANMLLFQEAMRTFAAFGSLPRAGEDTKKKD